MKVTRNPIGGVGKLSSPGKINEFSFFIRPSFLRILWSWLEILDLSHSALPRSVVAILDSGVLCLVKRARGGIDELGGEACECGGALEAMRAMEDFAEEKQMCGASERTGGGR